MPNGAVARSQGAREAKLNALPASSARTAVAKRG